MRVSIKSGEIDVMVTEGIVAEGGRSPVGKESSAGCCMATFETIVPVRVVHCPLAEHSRATGDAFLPAFFALQDFDLFLM